MAKLFANSGGPDHAASDLGLHCLPSTLLWVSRLQWVKLPFMMRVRRFNARKDCLVCIVGVIAGGHYDQGSDLNAKLHDHYFILFNGFVSKDRL